MDDFYSHEKPLSGLRNKTENELRWYALYVRSRHEKKVADRLSEQHYEVFLPLIKKIRQWSDRRKEVQVPLFCSYVFVRTIYGINKLPILQTEGVVKFINIRGIPSVVPDKQIQWIRLLLKETDKLEGTRYYQTGDRVEVIAGPLKNLEGVVEEVRGETRLVVLLDAIMSAVSVEIQPEYLQPVRRKHHPSNLNS